MLSSFTETPNFALIAEIAKIALNVLVRVDRGDREIALNVLVRADREDRDFDRGPPVRGFKEISMTF